MPDKPIVDLPYYVKLVFIALLVFLLFYLIYIGQGILLPLGFAFLFSILLRPIEKYLTNNGVPRVIAILC
jgi:predicted PurR-regulated permease PerM